MTADKDDWRPAVISEQSPLQLNTAHGRQADVEDQASCSLSMGRVEKIFCGVESADWKISCPQNTSERFMKRFVVVDCAGFTRPL